MKNIKKGDSVCKVHNGIIYKGKVISINEAMITVDLGDMGIQTMTAGGWEKVSQSNRKNKCDCVGKGPIN